MSNNPKAFVSYSWDGDSHRDWIADLARRLRQDGIEVTLDQWSVAPGDQLPEFMEKSIRENDYIIIVCTPRYRERSDSRAGGVGYEGDIMTGEVLTRRNNRKFIPVLRGPSWEESAPGWLQGKYYIDLSEEVYERGYVELRETLHGNRPKAPPVGQAPTDPAGSRFLSSLAEMIVEFLIIHDELDAGRRLFGEWQDEVMYTVENLRDGVRGLLADPTVESLDLEAELEELESSFEKILDYVPVAGGGHRLKERIREAGGIASRLKADRLDSVALGPESIEAIRNGLLVAQRQLRRLSRRGKGILEDRGLRGWREAQEEASTIGYGVLRVSYFDLEKAGVSDSKTLQSLSRELHMIGGRRTQSDGGRSIRRLLEDIGRLSNTLADNLDSLSERAAGD